MLKPITAILILFAGITVCGCKKKKPETPAEPEPVNSGMISGLPANYKSLNGYFYAGYNKPYAGNYTYHAFYAAFSDPTRNLLGNFNHFDDYAVGHPSKTGNIDVGEVFFNSSTANKNNSSSSITYFTYTSTQSFPNFNAQWQIEGNGSFKPLNEQVPGGFPEVNINPTVSSISLSAGYSFTVAGNISNYDSLLVEIYRDNSARVRKIVSPEQQVVSFSPADLSVFNTSSTAYVFFYAYNYSHKTINNKLFVFELSNKKYYSIYFIQ